MKNNLSVVGSNKFYQDLFSDMELAWSEELFTNPNYSFGVGGDHNRCECEKSFYEDYLFKLGFTEEESNDIMTKMGY